jgi:hypothetical protein
MIFNRTNYSGRFARSASAAGAYPLFRRNFMVAGRAGEFGDEGGEEVRGGRAGGGELRFQRVDQGHQLLHFGHDALLFGEGWEWDRN